MAHVISSANLYIKLIVEDGKEFIFGDTGFTNSEKDVQLLSLNYSQVMSVAGPINATVVNTTPYDLRHLVNFGCLIEVWIVHSVDGSHWCLTTGLINKVTRQTDFAGTGGKPARQVFRIEAFELGMILKQTNLFLDITPAGQKFFAGTEVSNRVRASRGVRNTIQDIVHQVAERWLYDVYQSGKFKFQDGTTLKDRLVIDKAYFSKNLWFNQNLNFLQIWNWRASIWDLINSILSPPFHECFCIPSGHNSYKIGRESQNRETGKHNSGSVNLSYYPHPIDGEKPKGWDDSKIKNTKEKGRIFLIIRPTPYDSEKTLQKGEKIKNSIFNDTEAGEIEGSSPILLRDKNLYTSNEQMYSVYQLVIGNIPISEDIQKTIFAPPYYDLDALKRVGYRSLYRKINTLNFNTQRKAGGDGLKNQLIQFSEKMYQWFRFNDKYMQGTFSLHGSPVITKEDKNGINNYLEKVGMFYLHNLNEPSDDDYEKSLQDYELGRYYIHQIDYRYQYGDTFYRTFHVSRGTPVYNSDLLQKIFVAKKYNSWKTAFDEGGDVGFEEKQEIDTKKPEIPKTPDKTKKEKREEKMNKISAAKMNQLKGLETFHNYGGVKKNPVPSKKVIVTNYKDDPKLTAEENAIRAAGFTD